MHTLPMQFTMPTQKHRHITKATEIQEIIVSYIDKGILLDRFTYQRLLKDAESIPDYGKSMSALGYIHAAYGDKSKAIECLECCWLDNDYHAITNYIFLCGRVGWLKRRGDVAIKAAESVESQSFSLKAALTYHSRGDEQKAEEFFEKAVKLSNDQDRADVEGLRAEQMKALRATYEATGATPEQFSVIAGAIEQVAEEYRVRVDAREISPFMGGDYVVEVATDNTDKIIDMNFRIAEILSSNNRLDNLDFTPRFEHIREMAGASRFQA